MSTLERRGAPDRVTSPWAAMERLFEREAVAALTMGTAVGRATVAASRRQFELLEATGTLSTGRSVDPDERTTGRVDATTSGGNAGAVESAFDRYLDAAAPFGHAEVDRR